MELQTERVHREQVKESLSRSTAQLSDQQAEMERYILCAFGPTVYMIVT